MGNSIGKNISKSLSGKYSQKLLDQAKHSTTDVLKTSSKRVNQKTAEATGNLIGSRKRNLKKVKNENDKKMSKERYVSRKKMKNYWWFKIKIIV